MMPQLNLPAFEPRLENRAAGSYIFDLIRKKMVVLTPEEWVRQHFINFLVNQKKYPLGLISIEKQTGSAQVANRTDLVVYSQYGKPWMIIECKAPSVNLDMDVFYQVLRYHAQLNALFVVVTNGLDHYCVSLEDDNFKFNDDLPPYPDKSISG